MRVKNAVQSDLDGLVKMYLKSKGKRVRWWVLPSEPWSVRWWSTWAFQAGMCGEMSRPNTIKSRIKKALFKYKVIAIAHPLPMRRSRIYVIIAIVITPESR